MPTDAALAVGTRSVILSLTKLMTNSSSFRPATSCSSIETIWPTPCAGYTMNSPVLKPCRWVVFLVVIPRVAPSASGLRRRLATGALPRVPRAGEEALRRGLDFFARRTAAGDFFELFER